MNYVAVIKSSATQATVQYFQSPREAELAGPAISLLQNTEENRKYCEESCEKFNQRYSSESENKIR